MASTSIAVTTPDSPVTIKVAINGSNRKFKLPLRELNSTVFPDKLRSLLQIEAEQKLLLERFSDSSNGYIVLDVNNPSSYKQLYRAAKAKLKLRIKATVGTDQPATSPAVTVKEGDALTSTPETADPATQATLLEFSDSTVTAPKAPESAARTQESELPSKSAWPCLLSQPPTSLEPPAGVQVSFQVSCDNCHKCIEDVHFHCSICSDGDYDLCETCAESGKWCSGAEHWMIKRFIKDGKIVSNNTERLPRKPRPVVEKEPLVPGAFEPEVKAEVLQTEDNEAYRTCNECVRELPNNLLVTCTDCEDFDLCIPCHVAGKGGHHPGHSFKPIVDDEEVDELVRTLCRPGRNVQHNAVCDGCDKPIRGVRHKCLDCPDWDYCNECILSEAPKSHPDHRFVPVYESLAAPKSVGDSLRNYHFGIYCDGPLCKGKSNQYYIRGIRYKCAICHDTDFCAVCEAHPSNNHNITHPLIKFKTQVRNVSVSTIGEDAKGSALPAMGDRGRPAVSPTTRSASINASSGNAATETPPPYTPAAVGTTIKAPANPPSSELDAHFVRDLVKDGTTYVPDVQFRQVWTMRNPGPHSWPVGCSVRRVGGDNMLDVRRSHAASTSELTMATETNQTTATVHPGQEVGFMVSMRTPMREGKYISYWRLKAPDGTAFGHKLWCDIEVKSIGASQMHDVHIPPPPPHPLYPGAPNLGPFKNNLPFRPPMPLAAGPQNRLTNMMNDHARRHEEAVRAAQNPAAATEFQMQMQLMQLTQRNKQALARMRAHNHPGFCPARKAYEAPKAPEMPEASQARNAVPTNEFDQKFSDLKNQLSDIEARNQAQRMLWREQHRMGATLPPPRQGELGQRFRRHPMPAYPEVDATGPQALHQDKFVEHPLDKVHSPFFMNSQDRRAATAAAAAAAAAASAASAKAKDELETASTSHEDAAPTVDKAEEEPAPELHGSAMVFPKLEKESPTSSTQLDAAAASPADPAAQSIATVPATETETITSAGEEEQFENLSAADVEFYGASEESSDDDSVEDEEAFLTDEEYDILDASDEEVMNRGKSGL